MGAPVPTPSELFDPAAFDREVEAATAPVAVFKGALKRGHDYLKSCFYVGERAHVLVRQHSWLVDQLLVRAWTVGGLNQHDCALLAVGGYGRGELHPGSDIDVAVVLRRKPNAGLNRVLERFVTFLWDIGLEVGHSVRTVRQCQQEARGDITVATNLMEARLLAGPASLADAVERAIHPAHMWPTRRFFEAKLAEQIARHHKYHDTSHNLEPNIKEGPGGLRDIQMIAWVAKRHFDAKSLEDLKEHGFLTQQEFHALDVGQELLWRVRYALHLLTGRREDRLIFDHQRAVAEIFGFHDSTGGLLGVERFMRMYYRAVTELSRLNEMLLEIFDEEILLRNRRARVRPLNNRFQIRNDVIEVRDDRVFKRYPFALLEIFLLLQLQPEIKGVRASTIRLIREHRHLIDTAFRNDLRCRSLFMEIIRQPRRLGHELQRMHRYGVLEAYLPVFEKVVGLMQFDLFHVYTVDEHTLFVVRNMRRFWFPGPQDNLPLCEEIAQDLPKPELLYLAGLFHDIAKGRGGDHSELGEQEAIAFCRHHQLSSYDAHLVAWLVRSHLVMSRTAQRKDITDSEVISEFANLVGDRVHLNYLYLLTVADIRGTNPALWNGWKDALLKELYRNTLRALRRGLQNPIDHREHLQETQEQALRLLDEEGADHGAVMALWQSFGDEYFLRHRPDEVAWHTGGILARDPAALPLVQLRSRTSRGGTEIFIYARDMDFVFAVTTQVLDQLGLTIQDARIINSRNGYTLDTYIVLEAATGQEIDSESRMREVTEALHRQLSAGQVPPRRVNRHVNRQLKHFSIQTTVGFADDPANARTIMEVIGTDRPGFLSRVGMAMQFCSVRLQNAKIATFGERVEDIFYITGLDNRPVVDPIKLECLRETIIRSLAT